MTLPLAVAAECLPNLAGLDAGGAPLRRVHDSPGL